VSKKCLNTTILASSPKKEPRAAHEIQDPPDPPPSPIHVFNPGCSEKTSTRAIFKVARKGKNKIVSVVLADDLDSTS
jgi:hypothetical protein